MKTKILLIHLFTVVILSGCIHWEMKDTSPEGKIKEVLNEQEIVIEKYNYGSNSLLEDCWKKEDFYTTGEKAEYKYTYNTENRLVRRKGYEPGIMYMSSMTGAMGKDVDYSYEYDNNGRIVKIKIDYDYETKYPELDHSVQTTFEYHEESVVITATSIINPLANTVTSYVAYYFNNSGNIEKTEGYYMVSATEKRISNETVFTYDSKKSPYDFEPGPVSKNNVLKKTMTAFNYDDAGNQSIAYTSEYLYEYTYNENDYPISQTETMPNKIVNIKYFKY